MSNSNAVHERAASTVTVKEAEEKRAQRGTKRIVAAERGIQCGYL